MNDKIYPISFLSKNQCHTCRKPTLYLILKDIEAINILPNGIMGDSHNIYHDSYITCSSCGSKFNYNKYGFIIEPVSDDSKLRKPKKIEYKEINPFYKEE